MLERTVITSDAFRPRLDPMRILMINDCHYLPISPRPETVHLALARVAGYATAKLGLPAQNAPLLFELNDLAGVTPTHQNPQALVATTKLSQFVSAPLRRPRPGGSSGRRSFIGCNRTRRCRP